MNRQESWGWAIKGGREALGITQAQLADQVGVRQSSVARWETGRTAPDDTHKLTLARLLDTSVYDLFPLEDETVTPLSPLEEST